MTKLWVIRQTKNNGYGTYDSAVVAAPDEATARYTHPGGYYVFDKEVNSWVFPEDRYPCAFNPWTDPQFVTVEYLGETDRDISGVIVASFNAG